MGVRVGVRVRMEEKKGEERRELFSKTVSLRFENIIRIFVRPERHASVLTYSA